MTISPHGRAAIVVASLLALPFCERLPPLPEPELLLLRRTAAAAAALLTAA
jgi:hypothetical protein